MKLAVTFAVTFAVIFAVIATAVSANTVPLPPLWQKIGVNCDVLNTKGGNCSAAQLLDVGSGWVRIEFKDATSTGPEIPESTFAPYDAAIGGFSRSGISVLLIIDYMTLQKVPWRSGSFAAWNAYSLLLASRAQQIAKRYGTAVKAYEIWNEPDLKATWVPPECYANLLTNVHHAIRRGAGGDGSVTVLMGGLASGNPGYVTQVAKASPSGAVDATAIGLHPYGQRPSADWPSRTWGFGDIASLLKNYQAVTGLPFWITEVGTGDEHVQGEFPKRFFEAALGLLRVQVTMWFCWSDGMVAPFGLLKKNGEFKQSYWSFRNFSH